ncbi:MULTISPECIES: hypothetical protein [Rothia]|uniref:hypothetical protein n=1 Tax=Rothia TaxID=32207 RepID=UPI000764AF22|nr:MULTISPECIES: hypothetical protein [Rothia]OFL76077.1 hypothetical protein HMPREF2749_06670 [Rothia sp. HMSC075F09]OFR62411.1 hypothetical protein HMPREF2879_00910 [Rothia sp. HMSC069C04]
MMMNYTTIALWGLVNVLQAYKMFRSIIVYEINRRRDKKLYAKNIYITRGDRLGIIALTVALLIIPAVMFMLHLLNDVGFHFLDIGVFLLICTLLYFFNEATGSYTKISPEGVEEDDGHDNKTFYPLNAIDKVTYRESYDSESPDSVSFETKSGKHIARFGPIYDGYPLLAMTRFKMENDRWPDMNNPEEVAQVKAWMNWNSTIPHIKDKEISGLAEVDM